MSLSEHVCKYMYVVSECGVHVCVCGLWNLLAYVRYVCMYMHLSLFDDSAIYPCVDIET